MRCFACVLFLLIGGAAIAELHSLTVHPHTVVGGNPSTGTVTLTHPAPHGGFPVGLRSNSSALHVPHSVVVPQGHLSANFPIHTSGVGAEFTRSITAFTHHVQRHAHITLLPADLVHLTVHPTEVVGGHTATGTVHLNGHAPSGGAVVHLQSHSVAIEVPPHVTVHPGHRSAHFPVRTKPVHTTVTRSFSATYRHVTRHAHLTIHPGVLIHTFHIDPNVVVGGQSTTGFVTLTGPAPAGGAEIIVWSDSNAVLVPHQFVIPAGHTHGHFPIHTRQVFHHHFTRTVYVRYGHSTKAAHITLTP
jgi:trimeric autotransporter adhesin